MKWVTCSLAGLLGFGFGVGVLVSLGGWLLGTACDHSKDGETGRGWLV